MAVMDEFKEEREALKHGTLKQKISYFWEYYRWHTFAVIVIAALTIYLIHMYATKKEEIFYAAILNCYALETADAYQESFVTFAGFDPVKHEAGFDCSTTINFEQFDANASASAEKISMYMAARQLDVIVAEEDIFEHYANGGTFLDIRECLTKEQTTAYEPYFYYVDRPLVQQIYQAELNNDTSFDPEIPEPTRPELMEDPVPVGIYVDSSEGLSEHYLFREEGTPVLGIVSNTGRPEMAVRYLEYLLQ